MNQARQPLHDQAAVRTRLAGLLGLATPTAFRIVEQRAIPHALPGTRIERLELATPSNLRVRGFLTGPDRPWQHCPAVLYCHAHGNRYDIGASELIDGRPALLAPSYAQALAEDGIVALCIDLPCFGERQNETESGATKRHLWHGGTLFGAMLADLGGALSLLQQIDGVDRDRIAAVGLSMGATLAFWLGALDTRVAAVAQLCCFADLATLVSAGAHDLHGIYMTVPGLLSAFSTGEIAGLVAPRPQLICIGLLDPLTPPIAAAIANAAIRAAYERCGAAGALSTLTSPDTGHAETPEMRAAVRSFLVRAPSRR